MTEPSSSGDSSGVLGRHWDSFVADQTLASAAIFPRSIGRWRRDLSPMDVEVLRPVIGPLLIELGYEHGLDWTGGGAWTSRSPAAKAGHGDMRDRGRLV